MIISGANISMAQTRTYSRHNSYTKAVKTTIDSANSHKEFGEIYKNTTKANENSLYYGNGLDEGYCYKKEELINTYEADMLNTEVLKGQTKERAKLNNNSSLSTASALQLKIYNSIVSYLRQFMLRSLFYEDYKNDYSDFFEADKYKNLDISQGENYTSWTVNTSESNYFFESEETLFQTSGSVLTKDGKEISFNLDLHLSREFCQSSELKSLTHYDKILTDPLVIRLESSADTISNQSFYFDLDGDGVEEEHQRLAPNQGFLALDLNEDGVINNGSELFGSKTGDGFSELSKYDLDNNGWIDEADCIYKKLKVWVLDEDGQSHLLNLKEADVGAIYLGKAKTEFNFTKDNNETVAKLRSNGFYLHENGEADLVSQIDI